MLWGFYFIINPRISTLENGYSIRKMLVFLRLKTKQAFICSWFQGSCLVLGSGSERAAPPGPASSRPHPGPALKALGHASAAPPFLPLEKQERCPQAARGQLSHRVRDNQSRGRK